mmetsp:Transcript_4141/g.6104  ORF Transcript_4141/g.6104 Transcript_4141/m.6104 type:complete len:83 (-) Transcript_4141:147-395(-)
MAQFSPYELNEHHGAFITSYICHGCRFSDLILDESDKATAMDYYKSWHYGKTSGSESVHIDVRGPHGDDVRTGNLKHCSSYP